MHFTQYEIQVLIQIHDQIQNNFKDEISVNNILKQYNIPNSTLAQAFKQLFHQSISQYRLAVCMQYATTLLAQGWQIKNITTELRYKTPGSFSRAFKKVYLCTPNYWKQFNCRKA